MGRLKYEKDFSEKLNKRRIEPSEGSWEKLQNQLDSKEEKKFVWFKWAGVAAAVIAGIMIIGVFYNDPISNTPEVVDSPSNENFDNPRQIVEETIEELLLETKTTPEEEKSAHLLPLKQKTSVIAEAEEEKKGPEALENDPVSELLPRDNFGNTEVALNQATTSEKTEVTDAEIETLLANARAQINSQRASNVVNVDAKDLLWNVEMEMEDSFREKVFDVLKEGFVKAKTAVANRNF